MHTMARKTLNVKITLDEIHCHDEGDGWGNAEPYLWTVFFKIDGGTVSITDALTLSGNATVHTTPGSHGNLDDTDVDAGDHVPIPIDIGEWQTNLKSIPAPPSLESLLPDGFGGVIGVVCILMEEDNVTDDGAESGHSALNNAVQAALNNIIATRSFTNQDISEGELETFESDIKTAIENAIKDQQDFFENIWSWLNKDDTIGSKVFFFKQDDLQEDLEVDFSERWKNEGDWELKGHITASPLCTVDLTSIFASRESRSVDLSLIRDFRNREFVRYPGLREWGNLMLRNNVTLAHSMIREEALRKAAVELVLFAQEAIKNRDKPVPKECFEGLRKIAVHMSKSKSHRAKLDARRVLEVIPELAGKTPAEVVKALAYFPPGIDPDKAKCVPEDQKVCNEEALLQKKN